MIEKKKNVIAYLHTHWDFEWYRSAQAFDIRLVEVFDEVLKNLQKGKIPCFYFDGQVLALLNYLKFRPEKTSLVKKFIKEKKLYIGPFYVSADSFLSSGAALYKNIEFGIKIARKFGQKEFIGYLADTFGHSRSIFKILKENKIENAIIWRGVPDIAADFTFNEIKTTRLVRGYYHEIDEGIDSTLDKIAKYSQDTLLLPMGADHLAPLSSLEKFDEFKKWKIKTGSPFDYFKKADFTKKNLEGEMLDNSNSFILPGIRTARIPEKCENAQIEWLLLNKAPVLNYFMKGRYDKELEYAQTFFLKNHAHDSIYGCVTDEVNKMVSSRQIAAKSAANAIIKTLVRDFKIKYLEKKSVEYAGIFNFSNYSQKNAAFVVTDEKIPFGQKIREFTDVSDDILYNINKNPMTEDYHKFYEYLIEIEQIKPFSFKNCKIKKPEKKQLAGEDFIENEVLKLFVLNNLIYALDKKTGEIYPDFIQIHSTKDKGDSYNYAPCEKSRILKLNSFRPKINGKIKSTFRINFEQNIKLDVSLSNNSDFLDLEIHLTNKQKNRNLQIVINTKKEIRKTLSGEPIGAIKRTHDPDYSLYEVMPAPPKSELKTNSFPMQKFVFANGVLVLTIGLYDYEIYKNLMKISFLRSIGIISNPKNPARSVPAGPPIECPDMQCLNTPYKFKLGLGFLNSALEEKEIEKYSKQHADELFNPYIALLGEFKTKNKTMIKNAENKEFIGITNSARKSPLFL